MKPEDAASVLWALWFVTWMAAASWSERTVRRLPAHREVLHTVIVAVGVAFLFGFNRVVPRGEPVLWRPPRLVATVLLALIVLGFAVTWWARIHLGRLWSSSVTRKSEHRVIDTGPYGLVRHPIYWGLTLSALATAAIRGRLSSVIGFCLFVLGYYIKARMEERFLREELGAAYDAYARRVGLVFPSIRR